MQKAQRRIRGRPLRELIGHLQITLRIALFARLERLVVERHRVGERRSSAEDQ